MPRWIREKPRIPPTIKINAGIQGKMLMNFNKEILINKMLDFERIESFHNVISQNCNYRIKQCLQPNTLKFNNLKIMQRNLV